MDFNPDVNFYIKGSIYNGAHFDFTHYSPTGLNWSITGSVVTDQNILFTAGNTGTLTTAPPPSFDPRWASAGSGVTVGSYHTALP
jgi:hypothetical protein